MAGRKVGYPDVRGAKRTLYHNKHLGDYWLAICAGCGVVVFEKVLGA